MRRLDAPADARAHGKPGAPSAGAAAPRARLEIGDAHAMSVAEAMHVAGLQRIELGKAGVMEGSSDRVGL